MPEGTGPIDWTDRIQLEDFTDDQLVEKLADPNIWWRRNSQRLLVDRNPAVIPKGLTAMAGNSEALPGQATCTVDPGRHGKT